MRQGKINVAFGVICNLYKIKGLKYSLSNKLFQMKRELQPFIEHYHEKEVEILEEWDALTPGGAVRTDMPVEDVTKINAALDAIRAADVDYDIEPITIKLTDKLTDLLGITGEVIEQLDGFVRFEMEDDEE